MKRVLFVCHGNICRSPMAEFVFKDLVRRAGREGDFEIASAATSSEELGNPVYLPARRELAAHGLSCEGKTARRIEREDYGRWDFIVGMDEENRRNLLRLFGGDPENKVSLLLDWTGRRGGMPGALRRHRMISPRKQHEIRHNEVFKGSVPLRENGVAGGGGVW